MLSLVDEKRDKPVLEGLAHGRNIGFFAGCFGECADNFRLI
jgi:hypothetical protein